MDATEAAKAKADLWDAVEKMMRTTGEAGLQKLFLLRPFIERGVNHATAYRWYDRAVGDVKRKFKAERASARERAESAGENGGKPPLDAENAALMAEVAEARRGVKSATGIAVMDKMIAAAEAGDDACADGRCRVRNASLLLQGTRELRSCAKQCVALARALTDLENTDKSTGPGLS